MKKNELHEILPGADLRFPEEVEKRIKEIEHAKTILIYAGTGEMDPKQDIRVFEPLNKLTALQQDLIDLKEAIENYSNKG